MSQLLLLGLTLAFVACGASSIQIDLECGRVEGIWNESTGVARFLGIPYAKPPVGALRFRNPEPPECWRPAVRNGTRFGADCMQSGQFNQGGSEDCLFTNVWMPNNTNDDSLRPVLVYSYGGDLTDGKSSSYDFEWLAQHTGMVIVSMNYRVNLFGFLALRELSATSHTGVSGNVGFHDQVMALRWVHDNAKALRVDTTRVTFFGQSSGGTSVYALLASPQARGLFTRAISLSGSANLTMDLHTAERQNEAIRDAVGCAVPGGGPEAVVACLQNKTASEVQQAVPQSWNTVKALWSLPPASAATSPHGMGYQGIAIVDGDLVVAPLQQALRQGVNEMPVLLSSLAQEPDAQPGRVVSDMEPAAFASLIRDAFQPWGNGVGDEVLRLYDANRSNTTTTTPPQQQQQQQEAYDSIMADYGQTCATVATAIAATQRRGRGGGQAADAPVYQLFITARPSHPLWGFDDTYQPRFAFHSLDILAGLGHWDLWSKPRGLPSFQPRAEDEQLRAAMVTVLRNFTRDGRLSGGFQDVGSGCPGGQATEACRTATEMRDGGVVSPVRQLKSAECAMWSKAGFDERFWWSN